MRPAFGRAFVGFSFIPLLILLALVAVLGASDNSTEAVKGGEGAITTPPFTKPLTGMRLGTNLCQARVTWVNPAGTHDADFEDSTSPLNSGDKNFTGSCNNSTTNAPSASPATIVEFAIPAPNSNFASNITVYPSGGFIAPGPGNPAFNPAVHPPVGSVAGILVSTVTRLALKIGAGAGSPCGNAVAPEFSMLNGTVDFSTIVSGTVSAAAGGSPSTVTVSDRTGAALGHGLKITGGTGTGQGRYLTVITPGGGTTGTLTVDRPWEVVPDATSTYEITNQAYPRTPGISNHLGPLAQADPGNPTLPLHATRYPSYLLELFDPDLVHPRLVNNDPGGDGVHAELNGPLPPITPLARYTGRALVAGDDILVEFLIFSPGALEAFAALQNHPWAQIRSFYGYTSVTVLIDPTVPASPSAIQDFCSDLGTDTVLLGTALQNKSGVLACNPVAGDVDDNGTDLSCNNTPATDGTVAQCPGPVACGPRYTNPAGGAGLLGGNTYLAMSITGFYRDADNDGIENQLDTCPFNADTWDDKFEDGAGAPEIGGPRVDDQHSNTLNPPADGLWDDDGDGLNRSCDTSEAPLTGFKENDDEATLASGNVGSATDFTVTKNAADPAFGSLAGATVQIGSPVSQQRIIVSNTADTLTVAPRWSPNPTAGLVYTVINEQFANRQDNCPKVSNPSQFEHESIPEEAVPPQPHYPEDGGPRTDGIGDLCEANDFVGDGAYHYDLNYYPYCLSANVPVDDADGDGWCGADETTFGSNPALASSTPEHIYLDIVYAMPRQGAGARPFVDKAISSALLGNDISSKWPAGMHPESGMPVSGVARPCSNGFDDNGAGGVDRVDANCRLGALSAAMLTSLVTLFGNGVTATDTDADGRVDWLEMLANTDPNTAGCAATTTSDDELKHGRPVPVPAAPAAAVVAATDLNDDRSTNILDVFKMFPSWTLTESTPAFWLYMADLNDDGSVNILDVFKMFPGWTLSC